MRIDGIMQAILSTERQDDNRKIAEFQKLAIHVISGLLAESGS
jgi:hypothetical protein